MWCIASVSVLGIFIVWIDELYKNKFDIGGRYEFDIGGRFDISGRFFLGDGFLVGNFGKFSSASVPC